MRLIDADALCERIRKIYDGYMLDEGCTPIEFENMVDEQPTAYNVDKVVEEIQKAYCKKCRNILGVTGAETYCKEQKCRIYEICETVKAGDVE